MKRSGNGFWLFGLIVLIILTLVGSGVVASAKQPAADPEALEITSIKLSRSSSGLVLRMNLSNHGNDGITEFGLALAFLDQDMNQIYAYSTTLEDYANEICNWYYTPDSPITSGETYKTQDEFAAYQDAAAIGVAIRYYSKQDGTFVLIPESEWLWKTSQGDTLNELAQRNFYTSPEQSILDKGQSINIGYHYFLLDDYNASYYGYSEGGEWIDEIDVGSVAERVGLEVGDVVLSVDGIKPTENYYAVDYAMAKLADGESVDWVVEREGDILTITLEMSN